MLRNLSKSHGGDEIVQLYVQDLAGSLTRPVRELKGFRRVTLEPSEELRVTFTLSTDDLAFSTRRRIVEAEPGRFRVWIGGDSDADLGSEFEVIREN